MKDPLAALYAALSIYHNLDDRFSMTSDKWQGWASELYRDKRYIPELIQAIRNGSMRAQMCGRTTPTLDDVRSVLRQIKRNDKLDQTLQQLPDKRTQQVNISTCIDQLKQSAEAPQDYQPPGGVWSKSSWDSYLDRKYPRHSHKDRH